MRIRNLFPILVLLAAALPGLAKTRSVGKDAARKYFQRDVTATAEDAAGTRSRDHYLALTLGGHLTSRAYRWGQDNPEDDNGKVNLGVSYRLGEWTSLMDLLAKLDFTTYELAGGKARKLSVMPGIVFPEANSRFPLYFGAAAGIGIFFEQLRDESSIALDYQLMAGLRVFDVWESTGFLVETGIKNHLHLLSDGQLNSTFLAAGAVFTF